MEYSYSLISHIKIFNSDPICAIDLSDELLLFGTMLGYCGFYIIKSREMKIISEIEDEHIISAEILKDKLTFGVGDQKIIVIEKKDDKSYKNYTIKEIKNYVNETEHYKKCDNIFSLLKKGFLFSIELNIPKEEEKIIDIRSLPFTIKNYFKNTEFDNRIEISNFWVPFDFDGEILVFSDFNKNSKNFLKIYNIRLKKFILVYNLDDENDNNHFGHISHVRLINKEKIFLVHSYKYCQIRDFNFKLIQNFEHIGKEIIACDIYSEKNELQIIILDLNCSVYLYIEKNNKYGSEEYLFNLNKLSTIEREIKDQKFFSMGYPYFIKRYKEYLAISADQGLFLFKKE